MSSSLSKLLLLPFLLFSLSLYPQSDPGNVKFGAVSAEERELTTVPTDSAAAAYVLFDRLKMSVTLGSSGYPELEEYRHRRVKLLRESSFDLADVELYFHVKTESIKGIKAIIYLPDGEEVKLTKRDMIKEDLNDEYKVLKFTFPQVTAGAIIEYEYTKTDENLTIPSRYFFQEDVPVRRAEYEASYPQYFEYLRLGNTDDRAKKEAFVENRLFGRNRLPFQVLRVTYDDLPAYEDQPYVNNLTDYIPQVRLQLRAIQYPNQPRQAILSSWAKVTKELDTWTTFGRSYQNKGLYNKAWKTVAPLLTASATELEKATTLYNFVAGRISWNGDYTWTSPETPNKVFEAAEGTSGEMSMLLLALLQEAELEAYPLLVPMRDRGSPQEIYPMISQFDHLMVVAILDGKATLLDPENTNRPPGLPRTSALNHRGFVANPKNPVWIDIAVPASSQTVMANVTIDEEGMGEVKIQSRLKNYFAASGRHLIEEVQEDSDLPIAKDIFEAFPEAELIDSEIKNTEEVSGPLSLDLDMKVPLGQAMDDYLYVQPILCPVLEKGLADTENRIYPVDFGFPWQQRYVTNISIPEGYEVDELPESVRVTSEDGTFQCIFSAGTKEDRTVSLNFTVTVKRTVYKAEEYGILRDMFRRIIDLQESILVLKRAK